MKNLLKNVFRSFKTNKMAIIGLVFLVFLTLGVFCVMSNTTKNMSQEYQSISKQGNLHDFTVSELYENGTPVYDVKSQGIKHVDKSTTYDYYDDLSTNQVTTAKLNTGQKEDKSEWYVIPKQTFVSAEIACEDYAGIYTRSYHLLLSLNSTGLYNSYAKDPQSKLVDFELTTKSVKYETSDTVPAGVKALKDFNSADPSTYASVVKNYIFGLDFYDFNKMLSSQSSLILSEIVSSSTPLQKELSNKYKDQIDWRLFQSLFITSAPDKILYKVINTNPSDQIDKIVLFPDKSGNKGFNLVDKNVWRPANASASYIDKSGEIVPAGTDLVHFKVPAKFEEIALVKLFDQKTVNSWDAPTQYVYSQILHDRFKYMSSGECTHETTAEIIASLAATDVSVEDYAKNIFTDTTSVIGKAYGKYLSTAKTESVVVSNNGKVTFLWTISMTPQTCTVSNWTGSLSVVNPEHMSATDKRVIAFDQFTKFTPFVTWFNLTHDKEKITAESVNDKVIVEWFNWMSNDEFAFWSDPSSKTEMNFKMPFGNPSVNVQRKDWHGVDNQYKVDAGGNKQIIWGCGITPDFIYPVIDMTLPTPNPNKECLVYCNDYGYKSILLGYANSKVEQYIVGTFKDKNNGSTILNNINSYCASTMIYPKYLKAAYMADDTNNVLNGSSYRISYIPKLIWTVNIVSIVLCSFIAFICIIISFVVIKRYIESNRVSIGIMRANGISKIRIALSLLPFALLPAVLGGIASYVVGFFLQILALNLFANYWMLPTSILSFNWISLFGCVIVPFLLFSILCVISTFYVLRTRTVELMKPGSEFKTNYFSLLVKRPFSKFGILTRFRVSLAFNSLWKLALLALMSMLSTSALVFSMATFGKLLAAQATNSSQYKYKYAVQLATPTTSGGAYVSYDLSEKVKSSFDDDVRGLGMSDPENYIYNRYYWNDTEPLGYGELTQWTMNGIDQDEYPRDPSDPQGKTSGYSAFIKNQTSLFLPNMNDKAWQEEDLFYLQNRMSSQFMLDHDMGMKSMSSNPWKIVLSLMPVNSKNMAASAYNDLINKVGRKVYAASGKTIGGSTDPDKSSRWWLGDGGAPKEENLFEQFFTTSDVVGDKHLVDAQYDFDGKNIGVEWGNIIFNKIFLQLIASIYTDYNLTKDEYQVSYNVVPLNHSKDINDIKDEKYTYVNGYITSSSSNRVSSTQTVNIQGIVPNSKYITLTNNKGTPLNSLLFNNNLAKDRLNNIHPVIANKFAAYKQNLKVGDTFTLDITNHTNRYLQKINPTAYSTSVNQTKFKVVGISEGTTNEEYFTNQYDANLVLGLPFWEQNPEWGPTNKSWNGTKKYMAYREEGANLGLQVINLASDSETTVDVYGFKDGVPQVTTKDKHNQNILTGFNGVYTNNTEGKPITSSLALYSYTGLYPGASVYKSIGASNPLVDLLKKDYNLSIANLVSGLGAVDSEGVYISDKYFKANYERRRKENPITDAEYTAIINEFINDITNIYGETTMYTLMNGASDVAAMDQVYAGLINTFNLTQASVLSVIIPMSLFIVMIISSLIIADCKKLAAMLKALGYKDSKNAMSFMSIYVPVVLFGLLLAIPLSIGLALGYQAIVFTGANIIVDVTLKWWYFIVSIGGMGLVLMVSYILGYVSLKNGRLVEQIK